jgi:hypothetical protein
VSDAFGRTCRIVLGEPPPPLLPGIPGPPATNGLVVSTLRCAFRVERTLTEEPNTAELEVYNLNPDHREFVAGLAKAKKGALIQIEAGYGDDQGLLFAGLCTAVTMRREPTEWIVRFSCEDGAEEEEDHPTKKNKKTIKKLDLRIPRLTPVVKAVRQVVEAAGFTLAASTAVLPLTLPSGSPVLPYAVAVKGKRVRAMADFLNSVGLVWSVQNGVVEGFLPGLPVAVGPLLRTGGTLIHAELDHEGNVSGQCLLDHRLAPGLTCIVQGETVDGAFTLDSVTHAGDNGHDSQQWHTEFTGLPFGGI